MKRNSALVGEVASKITTTCVFSPSAAGYVVGAIWDEGNMVQAMRRFGGRTIQWRYGEG